MASISPIVFEGLINEEGELEVQSPLPFPPGPVRITLESLKQGERLPDSPWLDECISAPCDLPHMGPVEYVTPIFVKERLPDPIIVDDDGDDL